MFALLMLIAGTATSSLAIYTWIQGRKPSVRTFALLLAAISLWLICISGWSLSSTVDLAMRWFWLQFLGVAMVPVLLLSYVLHFTGRGSALTPSRRLALWVIPLLTQAFAWTNGLHHLMFREIHFSSRDGILVLSSWVAGPWFLLYSTYSFGIIAVALLLMARAVIGSPNIFRRQLLALLIAIIPAIILTLLNTFQLLSANLWLTPMAFVLTGAVIVWAIVRHQMIAVVPVARDLLIEQMDDAMLVIDERERVVDLNMAMESLLGRGRGDLLSQSLYSALFHVPDLLDSARLPDATPAEIELSSGSRVRHYEVTARTLRHNSAPVGRLLVLRDITRTKLAQAELFTLATTDSLTGLYNRRQFFQLASQQVEIATRSRRPLSLLLFDIDHFKQVNDCYGHEAGDRVLVEVASRAQRVVRSQDIICRYGGEEFVILLVDTGGADGGQVAERLRDLVAGTPIDIGGDHVAATISVGVATSVPDALMTLDDLLRLADGAMYRAKQAGRNRVAYAERVVGGGQAAEA
ncbi:diguanylate cyclase [Oscillochloris sp. ZM17-4]|uniref:histidine kinase N-terminal 7TM domain-containing diguanylate cyclase n=1 Tax=Oscillochloris sp. ZM17-4 TaxID=2866714 RepID=UPI001C739A22|nr:diguanylate cyclase [Oscillochloris sp. ZM17-4]MBX0329596.1 diguanylate cyclase [Oscillochloris sp. ZM17-4]